jgi:uncharacterized protein DUF3631
VGSERGGGIMERAKSYPVPPHGEKKSAGIGKLPDTAASRSIPVRLRRKGPGETVERKRERAVRAEATPLRELIAEWATEIEETVATFDLAEMHELPDRAMDIWEPLLSIARLAGDQWFGRAQKAAIALSGRAAQDDDSTWVRLLSDIRSIFDQHDVDQLFSATVVSGLHEIEDASWAEWHGRPISKNAIARILKRYEIHPTKLRIGDSTANGYHRHDFEDTWKRYLPSLPPSATGTTGTKASESQKQAISNRNTEADVPVAGLDSNPHEQRDVPVVPDEREGKEEQATSGTSPRRHGLAGKLRPIQPESVAGETYDGVAWPLCATCDSAYDESHALAEAVTCPACAALRCGLITDDEADEIRFLTSLRVAA